MGRVLAGLAMVLGGLPEDFFTHGASALKVGEVAAPQECRSCHPDIYTQWRSSRHALAWSNSTFATEYELRPQRWCQNCHAPTAGQQAVLAGTQQPEGSADPRHGVSCAVCHIRQGTLYARSRGEDSPHLTVTDPSFGTPEWCGGCHQFNFPRFDESGFAGHTAHPMQSTVAQFRAGPWGQSGATCRECHSVHGFEGARDPAMLARALDVHVCGVGPTRMRVRLSNVGAGHTVPTGDVHRHLVLRAWVSTEPERLYEAYLGRRFEPDPDGGRRVISDTRIPAGEWRDYDVDLAWISTGAGPVNLLLRYVYVADEFPQGPRKPAEPVFVDLYRQRTPIEALEPCHRPLPQNQDPP